MKLHESLNIITKILSKTNNNEEISDLLEDILTPSEILEISDRILVIKHLKEWFTQRQIATKLWISLTTVSRWSRIYIFDKKIINKLV